MTAAFSFLIAAAFIAAPIIWALREAMAAYREDGRSED